MDFPPTSTQRLKRALIGACVASIVLPQIVAGASSWAPTLLVNTESFQTIDDGDGSTDLELRFGGTLNEKILWNRTKGSFQFTDDISVQGTMSGSSLNVDRNATVGGTLTATGAIRTKGNLSGSTLTVDGAINWGGQTFNAPGAQSANTFLKTDGNGNLTWAATSVGNGSGGIISLHPEYTNAVYFSSGATFVGQMTASGGTTSLENAYVWTSTRASIQDYWIAVRVRVPNNFSSWDAVKPLEFRYKTGVASATNNHLTVRLKDTAGANVALTNGGALASTTWATANISFTGGTWTPGSYFTLYVKLAANNTASANAAAGFMNINFETTTP